MSDDSQNWWHLVVELAKENSRPRRFRWLSVAIIWQKKEWMMVDKVACSSIRGWNLPSMNPQAICYNTKVTTVVALLTMDTLSTWYVISSKHSWTTVQIIFLWSYASCNRLAKTKQNRKWLGKQNFHHSKNSILSAKMDNSTNNLVTNIL